MLEARSHSDSRRPGLSSVWCKRYGLLSHQKWFSICCDLHGRWNKQSRRGKTPWLPSERPSCHWVPVSSDLRECHLNNDPTCETLACSFSQRNSSHSRLEAGVCFHWSDCLLQSVLAESKSFWNRRANKWSPRTFPHLSADLTTRFSAGVNSALSGSWNKWPFCTLGELVTPGYQLWLCHLKF